jgi:hypothetical protein
MGLDTVEKTASSTRLRHSSASWRSISETDDRDPVVMQAIETVTGRHLADGLWSHSQQEITQAIYDEIRRLDRESLPNRFEDPTAKTNCREVCAVSPYGDR